MSRKIDGLYRGMAAAIWVHGAGGNSTEVPMAAKRAAKALGQVFWPQVTQWFEHARELGVVHAGDERAFGYELAVKAMDAPSRTPFLDKVPGWSQRRRYPTATINWDGEELSWDIELASEEARSAASMLRANAAPGHQRRGRRHDEPVPIGARVKVRDAEGDWYGIVVSGTGARRTVESEEDRPDLELAQDEARTVSVDILSVRNAQPGHQRRQRPREPLPIGTRVKVRDAEGDWYGTVITGSGARRTVKSEDDRPDLELAKGETRSVFVDLLTARATR